MNVLNGMAKVAVLAALVLLLGTSGCSDSASSDSPPRDSTPGGLQSSSYALNGQAAPDFTLPRLEGGEMTLSDHFGTDIVILDFWATWCSPCRYVMPFVEETASEFARHGVVLYSINWGQDAQTVKDYLEAEGLQSQILLDLEAEVGMDQYAIEGLPATVVIGRDGKVKAFMSGLTAVQSGLRPVLEELTTEEAP